MNSLIEILHNYFLVGAGSLFLLQAIILFLRGKNNAARQTMAMMDLVWGSGYIIVIILLNSIGKTDEFLPFRARYVVVGGVYISLMMLYLMQVLIPGWLNWKRLLLVESPVVLFILTFYGVTMLLGQTVEEISTYSMLWDSIGHFNVWFRFVLLIAEIVYLTFMLKWLHGYEIKYIQWKNDNYANSDSMDISWIHTYYFIIMGITVFYLIVFLIGGRVTILCHTIFATASFSYLFYKTLFYENPYPIGFFDSLDEKKQQQKLDEMYVPICSDASETEQKVNEETFENKIPEYVEKIKVWMDEEKPYLYHDLSVFW